MAKRLAVNSRGVGCLIQAFGLVVLLIAVGQFLFPQLVGVGLCLFAVTVFAAGSMLDKIHICSECGNRVEVTSKLCPTCRSNLAQ